MPINSTNHGLSVLTKAGARKRLGSPLAATVTVGGIEGVARSITNCFNDATSGHLTPDFSSGHEGLDFACDANAENKVKAMYGGEVVAVTHNWAEADGKGYGNHVIIRSYTNAAHKMGFEHLYGHLHSVAARSEVRLTTGDTVEKGEVIGVSGVTGTEDAHLHVHVKPFDESGMSTCEFAPADDPDNLSQPYPPLATRISGTMNFACFLPADHGGPAIVADGKLLSARDAYLTAIPVYTTMGGSTLRGAIDGSRIGCYAVTAEETADGVTWYEIQFTTTEKGWVSKTGTVDAHPNPVQWVRVENTMLAVSTDGAGTRVRSAPGIATAANGKPISAGTAGHNVLGTLTRNQLYPIVGTFEDLTAAGATKRRWW